MNYEQQLKEFGHGYAVGFILSWILIFVLGFIAGGYLMGKAFSDKIANQPVCEVRCIDFEEIVI